MADRTSAYIFGQFFTYLAGQEPSPTRGEMVEFLWQNQREYDFSPYQMEANEALVKLGLAKMGIDPAYADDPPVVLYRGQPGFRE